MSDTDSFIDEVTEEVRKEKLFRQIKRYGWIAALAVFVLVGGAAWNEWRKAQERAAAEALGDAMLAALEAPDALDRAQALREIDANSPGGDAVLGLLTAAQEAEAEDRAAASARLERIATDAELPQIYRQIASYKALVAGTQSLDAETRIAGFTALATPGSPLRLLAEEQIALIELERGQREAALERLTDIVLDSEATGGLQLRAAQLITALGGALPDV